MDVADVEEHVLPVGILGDAEHAVGRFSLIVPLEPPAESHRADRVCLVLVDRPHRHVELVRALVVHVAVARRPEPVPFVVDKVCVILFDGRWSAPDIPVQIFRRVGERLVPDALSRFAAVPVRDLQLAELAVANSLHLRRPPGGASLLGAVLNDNAVLFPGLDGNATYIDVVAGWFFNVAVLFRLRGPDHHQRVPVVGRGHRNGVQILIVQCLTHVGDALDFIALGIL